LPARPSAVCRRCSWWCGDLLRAAKSCDRGAEDLDPDGLSVEAFFVSTMMVGLAEIGDKTQILALMLAARFRRPLPIIFGILVATLANHAAAALAGTYFATC
jgi:hypothetical protein